MNLKDTRIIIPTVILIVFMVGLMAGIVLVRRQQSTTGGAVSQPSSLPQVYLPQDFNRDGIVDEQDLLIFKQKYAAKDPSADLDGSGEVNSLDYNLFLSKME